MRPYDKMILKALRHTTHDNPTDLVGIIGHIDSRERLIISFEELESGLRRLVEAGMIQEIKPLHFFKTADSEAAAIFTGLNEEQYKSVCRKYRDWMQQARKELENMPEVADGPLVVCKLISSTSEDFSGEAEEAIEHLADQMEEVIPGIADAEIIGFEHSFEVIAK
jgi:hypothetical protein